MTAGSAVAKFSAILLLPGCRFLIFSGCLAGRLHTRVSAYTLIQFSHSHWIFWFAQGPERYRRFVEMEIKHGRLAMAGFLGVVTTYSGIRWPGYLSKAEGIKFEDLPGGAISSWAALPTAAWFQIVLFVSICETLWLKQDPEKDPGDVVPEGVAWARYPDGYDVWLGDGSIKQVGEDELILGKTWKLNAERNNGRAAMMGITGMIIHEALTGNPVFPIGESL